MRVTDWLGDRRDDVRFAFRQLKRSPGFCAVAVATLAAGIGATSALFSLADAALIRPLPFPASERLVMVWETVDGFSRNRVAPLNFLDWQDQNRSFEGLAAIIPGWGRAMTGADGLAELVPAAVVTVGFFDVLGVRPLAGRTFQLADATGAPSVVVIGERFWRSRFGADPSLVGQTLRLDGALLTVIGVVPDTVQAVGPASVWTILAPRQDRSNHYLQVIGRLKPEISIAAAQGDMSAIAEGIARTSAATNRGWGVSLERLRDAVVGSEFAVTSVVLLAFMSIVTLIACANVATLLVARTIARARELAVRAALGAGRGRIVAQLASETLVVALVAGAGGLALAAAILSTAPASLPEGLLPSAVTLQFDARVAAFGIATTCLVGLLCAVVPAWRAGGLSLVPIIAEHGRGATGRTGHLRSALIVGEVAAAVLVSCSAALLVRTLVALQTADPGYGTGNVLTMSVTVARARYPTDEQLRRFFEAVEENVGALPRVARAAWGSALPLDGRYYGQPFEIVGSPPPSGERPAAGYQLVSAAYFDALGISIVRGRSFTPRDTGGTVQVCIVNEAFVRRYLGGVDPVGMRVALPPLSLGPAEPVVREIVGVARQVKERPGELEEPVQVYVPLAQNPWPLASLVVRPNEGDAGDLATAVRSAIAAVDKDQAVTRVQTLERLAHQATSRPRFRAALVTAFAALAVAFALVGVSSVLAHLVEQRTRELGVRMALGATARDVLHLVLTGTARSVGLGIATGWVAAALAARGMATLLFGVPPLVLLSFAVAGVLLAGAAAAAAAAPAIRAARVNPVEVLRQNQ
jgi:putative ABC transport system permease protein